MKLANQMVIRFLSKYKKIGFVETSNFPFLGALHNAYIILFQKKIKNQIEIKLEL